MEYPELLDIIKTGEGYTIEFEESINSSIGKDICAFANSSGGKLIIGVEDKTNKVIGYHLTNSDRSKVQDIARNMNPPFTVQIEQLKNELKHKTKLELPKEALREAIINAMIHRDYNINSSVQINISPDKVEIINPGRLLFPKEELGKRSVLRNPILVDLIHRLGLVEKAGSGIKRMQKLAKEDNVTVVFKTGMFFEVIFHRKIENRAENRSKTEANRMELGHKSDTKTRQRWILDRLKQKGTIKSVEIINRFHIVKDTASRDLKYLIEEDKIVRKGGGNNVWYELKSEEEKL
ncbi:hypothetical protein C4E22_04025 [ANME-1 cluster archaeon AG-394-G06]|nr:hypothetical protein [ANME-1 cluster archaeon AG-394-G06]